MKTVFTYNQQTEKVSTMSSNSLTVYKPLNRNMLLQLKDMIILDINSIDINLCRDGFDDKDLYSIEKYRISDKLKFCRNNPSYYLGGYENITCRFVVEDERNSRRIRLSKKTIQKETKGIYVFNVKRFNNKGKLFMFTLYLFDTDFGFVFTVPNKRYSNKIKMSFFENINY